MPLPSAPSRLVLNPANEDEVRIMLLDHFRPLYRSRVEEYVDNLLDLDKHLDQFYYVCSVTGPNLFRDCTRALVSGAAVGSEMISLRRLGCGEVYGVEVEQFYVDICQLRLKGLPAVHASLYDGEQLPYDDEQFDFISSSHIIEHTHSPYRYLQECMRVLEPGGYLFLEYPTRYHYRELHTGLPSFEWLPRPIRNRLLSLLSSNRSPLPADVKRGYASIVGTNLQQISLGDIKRMLRRSGYCTAVLDATQPVPGIVRSVIERRQGPAI